MVTKSDYPYEEVTYAMINLAMKVAPELKVKSQNGSLIEKWILRQAFADLLPFQIHLVPPLLGALIGYVTNYIAIRMLFRPLRPWRLLGMRLPLTPGIIPAKRGELAQRMGEMVGSHLLTADDVRRALEKPCTTDPLKPQGSNPLQGENR